MNDSRNHDSGDARLNNMVKPLERSSVETPLGDGRNDSGTVYLTGSEFASIPAEETPTVRDGESVPLVSVLMLAYNHAATIAQAIQGVLAQEADFAFELIVGEDCSTDGTLELCERFLRDNPGRMRLITAGANVGMHKNFSRIWHRARGEYVAMCEGDDFWTDERKLQKQVDLLAESPEFSMCATYTRKIRQGEDGAWKDAGIVGPVRVKGEYTVADLIPAYNFHFSSILVRKDRVRFPRWFWDVYCVDRPLYLLCAEQGPVGFIPEVTSVYRLHEGGIWSPASHVQKTVKGIRLFERIDEHFRYHHSRLIRKTLGEIIWSYMAEALRENDVAGAKELYWKSLAYRAAAFSFSGITLVLAVFVRLYLSRIYDFMRRG